MCGSINKMSMNLPILSDALNSSSPIWNPLYYLAESEHDTSLPIMDSYDKSLFLAMSIMIYHCLQWSIMEDNDLQRVAF